MKMIHNCSANEAAPSSATRVSVRFNIVTLCHLKLGGNFESSAQKPRHSEAAAV